RGRDGGAGSVEDDHEQLGGARGGAAPRGGGGPRGAGRGGVPHTVVRSLTRGGGPDRERVVERVAGAVLVVQRGLVSRPVRVGGTPVAGEDVLATRHEARGVVVAHG